MSPAKRRRVNPSPSPSVDDRSIQSPVESSSDELAAGSDRDEAERRRASWSLQKVYPPQRPYPRSRSYSGSESPDELAVDADVYWRTSRRGRGRPARPARSPTPTEVSEDYQDGDEEGQDEEQGEEPDEEQGTEAIGRGDEPDREEPEALGRGDDVDDDRDDHRERDRDHRDQTMDGGVDDTPMADDYEDRSPTPVPPPPPVPPKPDKLEYRAKFLLRGHLRGVSAVKFSPDASMIASGGADAAVKVWDTRSGRLINTFEGHLAGISTISWSPDGATIASGSDDKTIRLWNVLTGKAHPIPFVGHHNYVYQIAFSPKGNILVSGSYDEAVFLWDVRSASVMRSLPAHSDPVGGIDVVWDGTLIASCATDGLIRIWDTATGQCLRTLVHEDNPPVTSVRFSPNGKFVLAWSLDDCVRLWNYVEGRCIKTYQGHVNRKYSLTGGFGIYGLPGAPAEAFVVSGSEDGAVLCWDVVSKKVLQRIEGHTGVVLGVDTCALEGKRLMVSCGTDGTVRVYEEADPETERETERETGPATEPHMVKEEGQEKEVPEPQDTEMGEGE